MQLTRQGEYAVRTIYALAAAEGRIIPQREIARIQEIPEAFLAKVAQILGRAGLVVNIRGAQGGMALAKPAATITLRDVVEAVEGPIALNQCLQGPGSCSRQEVCSVHRVWVRAQEAMLKELGSVTFAELVRTGGSLGESD